MYLSLEQRVEQAAGVAVLQKRYEVVPDGGGAYLSYRFRVVYTMHPEEKMYSCNVRLRQEQRKYPLDLVLVLKQMLMRTLRGHTIAKVESV